jgi:nucleoid-associated protein YgaU
MNSHSALDIRTLRQRPPALPGQRRPVDVAKERGSRPTRPTPPPGQLRLTRRGRTVVRVAIVLALLAVVLAAVVMFGGRSAATGERGPEVRTRTVVVHEGDTLWGIATKVAGPGDVRDMVYRIEELNSLPGPELTEGQELAVPRR